MVVALQASVERTFVTALHCAPCLSVSHAKKYAQTCQLSCALNYAAQSLRSSSLSSVSYLSSQRNVVQFLTCKKHQARHSSTVPCAAQAVTIQDHKTFVKDVAGVEPPPLLPALLDILKLKGEEPTSPADRRGMLPLAIPLTVNPTTGEVTALLRWPTAPEGMDMPVVRVHKSGVILLSKTIEAYVKRALAEEDAAGGGGSPGPMAAALEKRGRKLYIAGAFVESGVPKLDVFLMKKIYRRQLTSVGHYEHSKSLESGVEVSALITGEFYSGRQHFPGFGRPFVFSAELLLKVGRTGEAKDAARIALKSPWWTLGTPYQEVAELAGWGDAQLEFALERVALDQAAFLLDLASVDCSWDAKRDQLAALYEEGGLKEVADFISAGPK
eukprot:jgi/Mesen1/7975/ME000424S07147